MESPHDYGNYLPDSLRGVRGGSYAADDWVLTSSNRFYDLDPYLESYVLGFRVASVPEPTTIALLGLGALMLRRRK